MRWYVGCVVAIATAAHAQQVSPEVLGFEQQAKFAARSGTCESAIHFAKQVEALDAAYYAQHVAVDPEIAACLAQVKQAPPPAVAPAVVAPAAEARVIPCAFYYEATYSIGYLRRLGKPMHLGRMAFGADSEDECAQPRDAGHLAFRGGVAIEMNNQVDGGFMAAAEAEVDWIWNRTRRAGIRLGFSYQWWEPKRSTIVTFGMRLRSYRSVTLGLDGLVTTSGPRPADELSGFPGDTVGGDPAYGVLATIAPEGKIKLIITAIALGIGGVIAIAMTDDE